MKVIGAFIVFVAFCGLSLEFDWYNLMWLFIGIGLLALETIIEFFSRTERFIHRSRK